MTKPYETTSWRAPSDRQAAPPPTPLPPAQQIGYAVVGLGDLTLGQILPAFANAQRSKLLALVSGDRAKAERIGRQYGLAERDLYSYETFEQLRKREDVQVIYIVLPNSMHRAYTERAAAIGKHVLCEKPMATSPEACAAMIAACTSAHVKLMIAYRIQYQPHHRAARDLIQSQAFGAIKLIEAHNGQNQGRVDQWRHRLDLAGGGALPDIGLYCLNTVRFLLGEEPIEVTGLTWSTPGDPRFAEVEETCMFQLRFPGGALASCTTSYGQHESRRYRVLGETGWLDMDPAFPYKGLRLRVAHAEGQIERIEERWIEEQDQFALEIDHMSQCVIENKTPETPGEEGLRDARLMAAIYQSARTRTTIKLTA